ncbi:MAG: T9SS type A sorting domain-containing protein, partial [Bacteroidota bacterium]
TADSIIALIPVFHQLGIKNITFDSGWYGEGTGVNFYFNTGDYVVNADIIGTEQDLIDLISSLHSDGFKVRLWWVPGVAEKDIDLWYDHPDWYTDSVINSTGEGGDYYLDPTNPDVITWNTNLVTRFVNYGADGFKQDDIYNYINTSSVFQKAYENLVNNNLAIAQSIKPDFMINTCNCGLCQNMYHMKGQNAIITSDPVGSAQFRHRAKYLHALNLNSAAVLGDHVELTKGDIDNAELNNPAFYNDVDFSSIVPLGMVLETKFKKDPGALYQKWFGLYDQYKFYKKAWVNIPLELGTLETYLMSDTGGLYFSFFTALPDSSYSGNVKFSHLTSGTNYNVYDIVNNTILGSFTPASTEYLFNVNFTHSLVVMVSPYAGVSEQVTSEISNLIIYPNPVSEILKMQFNNFNSQHLDINILNSLGQIISEVADDTFLPGFYKFNADISQFNSGIYSVQIISDKRTEVKRFVVIKN